MSLTRQRVADAIGLSFIALLLLDYFHPSLVLLPTIAAGGDTPCHYPTAEFVHDYLRPRLRLHGWFAGAYLGHPLLLYYFPLPFVFMSALAPLAGLQVSFKLVIALGVCLLPYAAYLSFRLMRFAFPTPLIGAAAAALFLFLEANPIWGGTIPSTLAGEFAYAYGLALAVVYLGLVYRAYSAGSSVFGSGALLGLTAFAHGYAVLWAGLSSSYFLYRSRQPRRTLAWLCGVAAVAFCVAALWLLPLLGAWGWTTPFNDAWITVETENVVPPYLMPLLVPAMLGLLATLVIARRFGGADQRLLFLAHSALVAVALAAAGPRLGVIDVRFLPFAQLALTLVGAATVGMLIERLRAADLAALGLVILALAYADGQSSYIRYWIEWNYTGLESKELWHPFGDAMRRLRGGVDDARATVEYSTVHERAGSIRMYEMLPHFTGRSTLEGVYNQAGVLTHPIYYLTSELGERSPNPFRDVEFSSFDTESALAHLRLFNTRDVVAVSDKLIDALEARDDVMSAGRVPPYALFRLRGSSDYVVPMTHEPVRSSPDGWRAKALRWFTRKPMSPAHLVFTTDSDIGIPEPDPWLPPPEKLLGKLPRVTSRVGEESIDVETDAIGHPLLVKVAYHPRWQAEGALGPYLVSPGLMMVVPTAESIRLVYQGRNVFDWMGLSLTVGMLLIAVGARYWPRSRREDDAPPPVPILSFIAQGCGPPPSRRLGGLIPAALILTLFAIRFLPAADEVNVAGELLTKAEVAATAGRYADAAEYARHGISLAEAEDVAAELRLVRAEALLELGDDEPARSLLDEVLADEPSPELEERAQAALKRTEEPR